MILRQLIIIPLLVLTAQADITLPAIINNQMVIQSSTKAPVWGWATPGENITVRFAGQTKRTVATTNGKWMIKLDPLKVSTKPQVMTIKGENEIKLNDVLVGEVWLASGQSNMEFSIGAIPAEEQKIVAQAKRNKLLRMFCAGPKVSSTLPLRDVAGYWSDCPYLIKQMENGKVKIYDSHSAVAFFFALKLQQELKIPIAVIDSSWGGTKIESWISNEGYEAVNLANPKIATADEPEAEKEREQVEESIQMWRNSAAEALDKGDFVSANLKVPRGRVANAIYNGMIAPITPFAIKGVIWYQGESNNNSQDYYQKLRALTAGWNEAFNLKDMPFYLVQVAPYNYAHSKTENISHQSIYDSVVSAQYKAAKEIEGCDVINISDTVFGNVANVHPPHKKTAGDRLAALALNNDYGKSMISTGPRFLTATARRGAVTVTFENIDKGLETSDGKAPNWFELAGADKKFVMAEAKIKRDGVVVTSKEILAPKYIRMGWNNIAEQNLRDKNGWPVFSFNAQITP